MKLQVAGHNFKTNGSIEAVLVLLDDEDKTLFSDTVNLTRKSSRDRFRTTVIEKFPRETKGRDIEAILLQLSCDLKPPPAETDEGEETPPRESQADKLMRLVAKKRFELFHTPSMNAYAHVPVDEHFEIHKCRSLSFRQLLSMLLWEAEQKTPNSDATNSAITAIEGRAIHEGKSHELFNRVAPYGESIYYDLSDPRYRAVNITKDGWSIDENPPILFQRYQHQKPQVEPVKGGDPRLLLKYLNLKNEGDKLLFLVYTAACFVPEIAHPIIHPHGGQGSAKSTLHRLLVSLADPSEEDLLRIPRNENDLAQSLNHHWVCCFDNLTGLPDWLSDTFSRAVTGSGFSKRELFTDDNVIIYKIKRVIGLNGINVVALKPDLLDRCMLIELDRIDEHDRREEKVMWAQFEADKPRILGGFLDVLSRALKIHPDIYLETLPRLADFARWGEAVSRAFGYKHNAFMEAYYGNINVQNDEVLGSNPIAVSVLSLMDSVDQWEGTPAELLDGLNREAESLRISTKMKSWPKAPHILVRRLNELRVNLVAGGFEVDTGGRRKLGNKTHRSICISRK